VGGDTPEPHSGRRRPPPAPNTHPGLWDPNLGPLNFSAMVAPLVNVIVNVIYSA